MSGEKALQAAIAAQKVDAENIAGLVMADHALIGLVLSELSNKAPQVRFACSKSLLLLSERCPDLLYPRIDGIFELLESENQIIKWNMIAIVGNLAAVDSRCRIRSVLRKLYGFLSGGELITANHAIRALGKIGRAFPEERARITNRLLGIEQAVFDTAECRNIAIGKSILALEMYLDAVKIQKKVLKFARNQISNSRKATAAKARAFLRKYQ